MGLDDGAELCDCRSETSSVPSAMGGAPRRPGEGLEAQRLAPDAAIRYDDPHIVVGHQLGPEQRQLPDRADAAADLHLVADPEGSRRKISSMMPAARLESVPCKRDRSRGRQRR